MTGSLMCLSSTAISAAGSLVNQFFDRGAPGKCLKTVTGLGLVICLAILPKNLLAQTTYGAVGSGDWSNAATWTPGGGPPGLLDTAHIGTSSPAGSSLVANVSLTAATSVASVRIGLAAGSNGTLDLNGQALTVTNLLELGFSNTAITSVVHNGGTINANNITVRNISSFTYAAGDTSNNLNLTNGGTATTAALGNLTATASVFDQGSTLNLGANLSLTGDLDIRGNGNNTATVNAGGFDITARDIFVGRFGQRGQIINRGSITATRDLEVSNGMFALGATDSVANQVRASNLGTLDLHANTAAVSARITTGGTINTVATTNISTTAEVFDQDSTLNLGADLSLTGDLDIRGTGNNTATVNAGGFDITARDIFVGRFGNRGQIINRGSITATRDLEVSNGMFALGATDSVASQVRASNLGTLDLHANTAAVSARITTGGTINTVATTNVSTTAEVFDQGSTLNLGADLSLTGDLDIRGNGNNTATVNAGGFDITARDIFVGRFGQRGQIINRGSITATRDLEVSNGMFALGATDSVANQVRASNLGTLDLHANTAAVSARITTGGTINTVVTTNISTTAEVFDQGSTLNLGADLSLTGDLDIRGSGINTATVDAGGFDITARDIFVGRFGNRGQIINRGSITATRDLEVSNGMFALGASDSVANQLRASNLGTLDLHANTAAVSARMTTGGAINTAANTNISSLVEVFDQGSTFNMGADLTLTSNVDIRGNGTNVATVNANGFDITANQLFVGRFNNAGALLNDGAITVNQLLFDRSSATLTGGNDIVQDTINLMNSSTLNVLQALGETEGLTLNGSNLNIDASSSMLLDFDAQAVVGDDWAFRWVNPIAGDRIAVLTGLVGAGRIIVNSVNATSIFNGGDGYTYIGYSTVPEPSTVTLSLIAIVLAVRTRARRFGANHG